VLLYSYLELSYKKSMEKISFRYSLLPGKNFAYRILVAGMVRVSSPMGEFTNPVGIEMTISQKILSVDNEEALIGVVIDSVKADKAIAQDQLPEPGRESIMRMDPLGKVKWIDGQGAWQGAEHSMMKFPVEPIGPGESWVQRVEEPSGAASPFYTRYCFKGLNKKNRKLAEFETELFNGHPDDPANIRSGQGVFYFDFDENWIDSCENHLQYIFSMPIPEDPSLVLSTETRLQIDMERLK
jgi:hypothetical protein